MVFKTLEEYFLDMLARKDDQIEILKEKVEQLRSELFPGDPDKGMGDAVLIYKPVETVSFRVSSYYNFKRVKWLKEASSEEVLEKASTREGLEEVAKMKFLENDGLYSGESVLCISRRLWPLQVRVCGSVFLMDVYNDAKSCLVSRLYTEDKVVRDMDYPLDRESDLYEEGIKLLKAELERYAEHLKKEEA